MEQQKLQWPEDRKVFSVSELVGDVKTELEVRFREIWIQGEISNLRRPPSGHLYFTLKDDASQLNAVCFRMRNRLLKFDPADGMDVLARGSLSVYPPRGQLQLVVEHLEPQGAGALQAAFEKLKARLHEEGLFDPKRKRALPLLPYKIGIVTSPSGAAIQDILRVLQRRNDRVNVLIYPARVQGDEAKREIVEGIQYLNSRDDIDVMIVGRGGGSLEDLWAFNEESVARAIFESRIPVISAVGHEIDYTISDFVADFRAPTPSAAAEIVSAKREELIRQVDAQRRRAVHAFQVVLHRKRQQLHKLAASRAFVGADSRVKLYSQRLDELEARMMQAIQLLVTPRKQETLRVTRDLKRQIDACLKNFRIQLQSRLDQLTAFSPERVLERGYSIVTRGAGQIVRDPAQVARNEIISVRVARGEFRARREDDGAEGL